MSFSNESNNITSPQNPKIKNTLKLRDSKYRKKSELFLVEGIREIQRALKCGFELETMFVENELFARSRNDQPSGNFLSVPTDDIFRVSKDVYKKLAVRDTTEGVVAVFKKKYLKLGDVELPSKPIICVLDGVEKPGNLGAVLRSCDGAGVDLVLLTGVSADIYSPLCVRASLGAVFNVKVVSSSFAEVFEYLTSKALPIYGAVLSSSSDEFYNGNFKNGAALCFGSEAHGLSPKWMDVVKPLKIPMRGISDSLNISVACSVMLYEATKHRG